VPQVRARFLGANLGCTATALLPTFFITFFSYAHHRLAPQSLRRYLDTSRTAPVSRDERISGLKLFTCSLTTNGQ